MSTRPNMRTMQMQDTIYRQKSRIAALEAENARMREALESAGNVLDGIATATSSIPAFMPILEKIEAALATGSEAGK